MQGLKLTHSSLPSVLFWGDIKDLGMYFSDLSCKPETEESKTSNLCAIQCKLDSFNRSQRKIRRVL